MTSIERVLIDDRLASCSSLSRILFIGMLFKYQDTGLITISPRRIKAEIIPYDECNIDELLSELIHNGLLSFYEGDDEDRETGYEFVDLEYFNA